MVGTRGEGEFLSRDNAGLRRLIIPIYPQGDERRGANAERDGTLTFAIQLRRSTGRERGSEERMAGRLLRSTSVRMLAVCLVYLFTLLGELSASCVALPPLFFSLSHVCSHPLHIRFPPVLRHGMHGFHRPLCSARLPSHVIPDRKSFIEKYTVRAGRNMTAY